jgi:hypothetical protein
MSSSAQRFLGMPGTERARLCLALRCATFLFLANHASSLASVIPKGFTAIRATGTEFRCLNRTTVIGNFLLPSQIEAAGAPLLAAPIRIAADPPEALEPAFNSRATLITKSQISAEWTNYTKTSDFDVSVAMRGDCDGFCWYQIELKPLHPTKLRRLVLEIPRVRGTAKYLHSSRFDWSNVSQGLAELGGTWSSAFVPYFWLGDEERGLAWCAESEIDWEVRQPEHAVEIKTETESVMTRLVFLDHEETISKPLKFAFGLQASPVKNISPQWRAKARMVHDIHYNSYKPGTNGACELDLIRNGGGRTVIIHDSWTKYFGQMIPADEKEFRELIEACHKRGLKLLVYVGYGIARTAAELKGHHDNWSVVPLIPWNPGYKPEMRAFDATCAKSDWSKWLEQGCEKLFSKFDLDGIYCDGTSEAWRCTNESHGCGYRDSAGQLHPVYPILSARELMRQLCNTVHKHKKNGIVDIHMSSNLTLPTLSFADSLWNGEQFEGHTSAEKFNVPLHVFRTEFMGYAHGMDMEFLCYEKRPFTFTEAIALAWLHGIEVRPYPASLHYVTPIWKAMDAFHTSSGEWHPYWNNSGAVSADEDTKISFWSHRGSVLLFISHLSRASAEVKIEARPNELGLRHEVRDAADAITGAPIDVRNNAFNIRFDGMNYRLVRIE